MQSPVLFRHFHHTIHECSEELWFLTSKSHKFVGFIDDQDTRSWTFLRDRDEFPERSLYGVWKSLSQSSHSSIVPLEKLAMLNLNSSSNSDVITNVMFFFLFPELIPWVLFFLACKDISIDFLTVGYPFLV